MQPHISEHSGDITKRLHSWSNGNRDAENELFAAVLPNLRRLAHYLMKGERSDHPLEPTELVNQIYFPLAAARNRAWRDRRHFFAVAARAMRRHLIDCARARHNIKSITFEENEDGVLCESGDLELLVDMEGILGQLAGINPTWCTIVELKFYLGLTDNEVAETMGIKLRTMQRMWAGARQWLYERMRSSSTTRTTRRFCPPS